jgi:hemolysin III
MIFVLIAGTYTPLALLVLDGAWSIAILCAVWGIAAVGIVLKAVKIDGFAALGGTLYIVLGWMAVVAMPQIVRGLSGVEIALILAGGLMYTGGAIILATNRPNPSPRVFGYHEIWHSFTIGAAACHYAAVMMFTLSAR